MTWINDLAEEGGVMPEKKLFRVDVTRTYDYHYFVLAETQEKAQEDANEMGFDNIAYPEDDIFVYPVSENAPVPSDAEVWTGGPEGEMATAESLGLARSRA